MDNTWSKHLRSVFLLCSFFIYAQSDVPRPRGVSLSKASLYSPNKDFTCFDGTVTIPFSYVNDDYCDCFDGSDEPGTSACLNGVFHCTNTGHRPLNIPSSRVNDGICDCCDGTDEYTSPNNCPNVCDELGKEARAEAQRIAELYKAGSHLRQDLIEQGNKKRSEMAEQLAALEKDKLEAQTVKAEKEAYKTQIEEKENEALKVYREAEEREKQQKEQEEREKEIKEASEHFSKFDSNSDGILSKDEIKVVNVFDKNKDGEVDEEEIQYFFGEKDSADKDMFVSSVWQVLKPLLMMEQGMFRPADEQHDADHEHEPEGEIESEGHEDSHDLNQDLEQDQDGDVHDEENNEDVDIPHDEAEEAEHHNIYDEETKALIDEATAARQQYIEAERTVREIESKIRNIQENLEKDYGLQQEFATLDGQCVEYEDKEYVYKLCLFQKVTQKSKNGGAEVGLGNWGEWAGQDNKYSAMKYINGMSCWNGPQRSTLVEISCGMETKLLSVTEPYRCEYKIELSTPAACDESNPVQQHLSHDEL